jgi:hypothetical protein
VYSRVCRIEIDKPSSPQHLYVQHISIEDMHWMCGYMPNTPSYLVGVVNFTLLGSYINPLPVEDNNPGSFVSYLKDTDEYEDVCERFEQVLGRTDWSQCRLALIIDRKPIFLPKSSMATSASAATLSSAASLSVSAALAMEEVTTNGNNHSESGSDSARSRSSLMKFIKDHCPQGSAIKPFVYQIGIQRSASSISQKSL